MFPSAGLTDNQISEEQAIHLLTTFIKDYSYYDIPPDCLKAKSLGYKNGGYTIELVAEGCPGNPETRLEGVVGRWRVDAKTAEIYVQNGEGRYVPPQPENQAISHPVVREEQTVTVDSVRERWLLVWREPPKPICSPEAGGAFPIGAPCVGFRYGEYGQLDLVRTRPGAPNNLLPLGPLCVETGAPSGMAVLPHWPVLDGDEQLYQTSPDRFSALVRARKPVTVMHIADYDHDGRATEFPLQIGAVVSGLEPTVLVGISRRFPYLHAFGTVLHPKEPLVLRVPELWDTVLHARRKVTLIDTPCGWHGTEEQTEFELRFDKEGIHATRIVYSCGPDFSRGALKSREEF